MVNKNLSKVAVLIFATALFSSCKMVSKRQTTGQTLDATSGTSNQEACSCYVPIEKDFSNEKNAELADSVRSEMAKDPLVIKAAELFKVSPARIGDWIKYTFTPTQMGCKSFQAGGGAKYGADAYRSLIKAVATAIADDKLTTLGVKAGPFDPFRNATEYPDVFALKALHIAVAGGNGELRTDDVIVDGNPLTPEQMQTVKSLTTEDYLGIYHSDVPFKNAYDQMVKGDFVQYPTLNKVVPLLKKWQDETKQIGKRGENEAAIVAQVAKASRTCVSIHPFHDGNGRSCLIWGYWYLARKGIPFPILWAGEDLFLTSEEYGKRFNEGIASQRLYLAKFRN